MTGTYEGKCCTDCLMLIANGDTSGNERCETEEGEAEYLADIERHSEGIYWVPSSWHYNPHDATDEEAAAYHAGHIDPAPYRETDEGLEVIDWTDDDRYYGRDTEPEFHAYTSCDVCGISQGGDYHPVAGFPARMHTVAL